MAIFKRLFGPSFAFVSVLALILGIQGCNWNWPGQSPATTEQQREREEKTRDEAAKATERLKPEIQSAERDLDKAAETAAQQARAAAQGVREGWKRGANAPLDLNSASEKELTELPRINGSEARRIIRARPYQKKEDLVSKGVISRSAYDTIQDEVTAK